jgi:hypothetical protein
MADPEQRPAGPPASQDAVAPDSAAPAPTPDTTDAIEPIAVARRLPLLDGKLHPGELMLALGRAARAFVTYDARNETVRQLIQIYRDTIHEVVGAHGAVSFEVHPFEIAFRDSIVYTEHDREKSLAFRLFRDGVRQLTFKPDTTWEELLRLLEIMSIRYSRIRQHEDDTLTLLRQAQFSHIEFQVVDVYVPAEENPEGESSLAVKTARLQPPRDWDQPFPRLGTAVALVHRQLPDAALEALRREASEDGTVDAVLQVVRETIDLALRQKHPLVNERVFGMLEDVCKFFVVELRPKELVWTLREAQNKLGELEGAAELRKKFDDADLLERFLRDPGEVAADSLMPLFALVSGDHLDRVIDRFLSESDPALRVPLKTLLARLAAGKPDALLSRLGSVPTERVVDLFNVVCVVAPPERCVEAAYSLADHASPEVQLGALEVLAGAPASPRLHETMQRLLAGTAPRVRVRAATIYGRRGGSRAYTALLAKLEELARLDLEAVEAAALGRGLVAAAREHALPLLRGWIRPGAMKGLMLRAKYGGRGFRMLRWAAVAGLADDRSDAARELVAWLAEHSDEGIAQQCRETLEKLGPPKASAPAPAAEEPATKQEPGAERGDGA